VYEGVRVSGYQGIRVSGIRRYQGITHQYHGLPSKWTMRPHTTTSYAPQPAPTITPPLHIHQHMNRRANNTTCPLHTHPSQHPSSPPPASTNFIVGDIDVGLAHDKHLNAFVVIVACRDEHWSLANLWPHNTTHARESVRHCMAPKGTRYGCTNKGQCGYGWTLYVVMHCALYLYVSMRV